MNFFPTTLEEAQLYGEGTYLGGATDLLPLLKNQVRDDRDLIFLSKIPELKEISPEGGYLKIGTAVTLSELAESTDIQTYFPALAQAAQAAASPQIRNIATIGGNIMQDRRCIYFNQSAHWRSALPMCFKTGGEMCIRDRRGTAVGYGPAASVPPGCGSSLYSDILRCPRPGG